METIFVRGKISVIAECDPGDGVKADGKLISEQLCDISGKNVSIRMFISDTERTKEELKENQLLSISGAIYARHNDAYSDYTGYLWTNDDLTIGGHDLLSDIATHEGKFLHLEVDVHTKALA